MHWVLCIEVCAPFCSFQTTALMDPYFLRIIEYLGSTQCLCAPPQFCMQPDCITTSGKYWGLAAIPKGLPQCPPLPQYCSNALQWALLQCFYNTAIVAVFPQYCSNTLLPQYCRNAAIAAIPRAHCNNPQCLNALPQYCTNVKLALQNICNATYPIAMHGVCSETLD